MPAEEEEEEEEEAVDPGAGSSLSDVLALLADAKQLVSNISSPKGPEEDVTPSGSS